MDNTYMTTKEAARLLEVSTRTIIRWIDSGKLQGTRTIFGRVALKTAVEEMAKEKTTVDAVAE